MSLLFTILISLVAIKADPKNHEKRWELVNALYKTGDLKNAWQQSQLAFSLDPENETCIEGMATILMDMEELGLFTLGNT